MDTVANASATALSTPTATAQEIELAVRGIIAQSLAISIDQVSPTVSLIEGLGAESLDFLDIVFQLERTYQIQITRGELEKAARGDMSEEDFAPKGVISDAGLVRLRELMPEAADKIVPGLRPAHILALFTVQTFVQMVLRKQAQSMQDAAAAKPDGASSDVSPADATSQPANTPSPDSSAAT